MQLELDLVWDGYWDLENRWFLAVEFIGAVGIVVLQKYGLSIGELGRWRFLSLICLILFSACRFFLPLFRAICHYESIDAVLSDHSQTLFGLDFVSLWAERFGHDDYGRGPLGFDVVWPILGDLVEMEWWNKTFLLFWLLLARPLSGWCVVWWALIFGDVERAFEDIIRRPLLYSTKKLRWGCFRICTYIRLLLELVGDRDNLDSGWFFRCWDCLGSLVWTNVVEECHSLPDEL